MHLVATFELIIMMLVTMLALQYPARRRDLPPAVALLVGLRGGLAFMRGLPDDIVIEGGGVRDDRTCLKAARN